MKAICSILFFLIFYCADARNKTARPQCDTTLIGQCMDGTDVRAKLSYAVTNRDTAYILSLRNAQINAADDYHSIAFSGSSKLVNELYGLIKLMLFKQNKTHKNYSITIALGAKLVVISTTRILGVTSAVICLPDGYNYLTDRQLDKVFGKI